MRKTEILAYAAGIIDGEGCIRISKHNSLGRPELMGWISVGDRLPLGQWSKNHLHLSEEVLIANSCSVNIGFYNRHDGIWYVEEPAKGEWIDKITHWMPLPANPHDGQILELIPPLNLPDMKDERILKLAGEINPETGELVKDYLDAAKELIQAYKELIIKENKHLEVVK